MLAWTCFAGSCWSCVALQRTPMTKLLRSSGSARAPSSERIALHSTLSNSPPTECCVMQMFRSFTLTKSLRSENSLQEQHDAEALRGITDESCGKDGLRSSQLAQVLDDVHQSGSDTAPDSTCIRPAEAI